MEHLKKETKLEQFTSQTLLSNMIVSTSIVSFRIDIDFPEADVDMVLREIFARGDAQTPVPHILCDGAQIPVDKKKLPKTPSEASVDFALNWLAGYVDRNKMCTTDSKWETDYTKPSYIAHTESGMAYTTWPKVKTELEEIGVTVKDWYGLMQGTCHLNCEIEMNKFNQELVLKAQKIVQKVFKKFVKYYKAQKVA